MRGMPSPSPPMSCRKDGGIPGPDQIAQAPSGPVVQQSKQLDVGAGWLTWPAHSLHCCHCLPSQRTFAAVSRRRLGSTSLRCSTSG